MELTAEDLKPIVEPLVKELIAKFVQENELRARELSLMERVVRVEEELKNLNKMLMVIEEANQKRFEAMEKRLETMEKANQQRFEALQREMDKRFEAMEKRFEAMEKANQQRFEALQREMDKRFEALEKRLNFTQWMIGIGFGLLGLLITVANFLAR